MTRAVSSDELRRVEAIVNDMIKAELNVHTEVVPLPQAMAIQVCHTPTLSPSLTPSLTLYSPSFPPSFS